MFKLKLHFRLENILCLDPCILNGFLFFGPYFALISVFLLAALLKLGITVSFLWLSLPVHSGSLNRTTKILNVCTTSVTEGEVGPVKLV